MVEMHVFGLALDEESQVPILILKDKEDTVVLPIWIGAMEAMAISMVLNKVRLQRPLTHDLLLKTIEALGAAVLRVELTSVSEGTYYAALILDLNGKEVRVDSRPSDSIALALRANAPIMALPGLLEAVSTGQDKAFQPVLKDDEADKWTELLAKLDPDDNRTM
jgi:hypothetical protein